MRKAIRIKDPLYDYIEINDSQIYEILNSPEFHRLKDIIQTSYSPVYPSSLHNRFIHSIGVYYLGTLAVSGIKKNNAENLSPNFNEYSRVFLLACILHDIGHAPFSHTGEDFYEVKKSEKTSVLREKLVEKVADESFSVDFFKTNPGAPHEVMSALLGINLFEKYIKSENKSYFARCIIGLKYDDKKDIRNCFIELLNSKTIDVDKLDYLLRDSYFSGFKSFDIDYIRLLSSTCILQSKNFCELGFTKAALSTLESVILAHDMERKWLQCHPVILYENKLVSSLLYLAIEEYASYGIDLFSIDALTQEGLKGKNENGTYKEIRLLSDSDIINTVKSQYTAPLVKEYFDRSIRRKGLWKSESEYRLLFENKKITLHQLVIGMDFIKKIFDNYPNNKGFPLINEDLLKYYEKELTKAKKINEIKIGKLKNIASEKIEKLNVTYDFLRSIKEYTEKIGCDFNFVFIISKQFNSKFNEDDLKHIKIKIKDEIVELQNAITLFSKSTTKEKCFYIYCSKDDYEKIDVKKFSNFIASLIFNFNED